MDYLTRINLHNLSYHRLASLIYDYTGLAVSALTGAVMGAIPEPYPISQIDKFTAIGFGAVGVVGCPIGSAISNLDIVSLQNYPREKDLSGQPNIQYAAGQGTRNLFSVGAAFCWAEGIKNSDSIEIVGAVILTGATLISHFSTRNKGKKRLETIILENT